MPTINFLSWNSRTNRISIKWVNHNGWIDIFVIKENYYFCLYFRHISLCFYSNFKRGSSSDAEFNYASMSTHTAYFWWTPLHQKQEIPKKIWWWHHHHFFSGISCFWGSGVRQKYVVWVCVGCIIKFCIQRAFSIKIWVKT